MLAHTKSALDAYYKLHEHAQSLNTIEKAVIGILVASLKESVYCLGRHKMIARLNGLSKEEVNEIVDGTILFNERCHYLSGLVTEIVISKGNPEQKHCSGFLMPVIRRKTWWMSFFVLQTPHLRIY